MINSFATLDVVWMLICAGLVFIMQAGFMCLESGLVRSKNSINVAVKNLLDICLAIAVFWLLGYGLMFGDSYYGWLGTSQFIFEDNSNPWLISFFIFQAMFCGTATTIVSGAVAERLRFFAYLLIAAIISAVIYPIVGHWIWAGVERGLSLGWLGQLGFVDFAGSTVVHSVGGWVALAALLVVGARKGRFEEEGQKIQGYNLSQSALGALLLWFGWIGFNGGSTLGFNAQTPSILLNTLLGASFGGLSVTLFCYYRLHYLDVVILINGVIAGLVSVTASCHIIIVLPIVQTNSTKS